MQFQDAQAIAYGMPGGEACVPSRSRPIDLVHLSRQTLGDRAVESEVLSMFMHQALLAKEHLVHADRMERKRLAHGLRGSALGVGAFAVAEHAASIEKNPADGAAIAKLARAVEEVRDFIAAISR